MQAIRLAPALVLAFSLSVSAPASAQSSRLRVPLISGEDLRLACAEFDRKSPPTELVDTTDSIAMMAQCAGTIDGFFSGVVLSRVRTSGITTICEPASADYDMHRKALMTYFQKDPSSRQKRAGVAMGLAYEDAYPCPPCEKGSSLTCHPDYSRK